MAKFGRNAGGPVRSNGPGALERLAALESFREESLRAVRNTFSAIEQRLQNLERINELADGKQLKATVVAPQLDGDPLEQLAAYEAAGTERIILPPTGDWHHDYDQAADLRTRYHHS